MEQAAYTYTRQLEMVWPYAALDSPPTVVIPADYTMRTYRPGDEAGWSAVMEMAGFGVWDEARLQPWRSRILPASWMIIEHQPTQQFVATAFGIHDHNDDHLFGGELGWVAADPAHSGKGLGRAVCAAVTARLIDMGYRNIHLYTEDYRLPALYIYLSLGYVPWMTATRMDEEEMASRWQRICAAFNWPFTPDAWRAARPGDPYAALKPLVGQNAALKPLVVQDAALKPLPGQDAALKPLPGQDQSTSRADPVSSVDKNVDKKIDHE